MLSRWFTLIFRMGKGKVTEGNQSIREYMRSVPGEKGEAKRNQKEKWSES